mgnify:CR=1 FL=1
MSVAIVDYGSGNLRSAAKAFERMAGPSEKILVTDDVAAIAAADRIVLPGVGAFGDCRRGLAAVDGAIEALEEAVIEKGRPFLGICVGMQLMADEGREHGTHPGFGWIPGAVEAIRPDDPSLKVPHMGWNLLADVADHPVLAGLGDGRHYAYFVHSYHLVPKDPALRLASVDYGGRLTAVVGRDNMIGTQFHPEKSQASGLRLIANFLEWRP